MITSAAIIPSSKSDAQSNMRNEKNGDTFDTWVNLLYIFILCHDSKIGHHFLTTNVVRLSAFPPHNTTLSIVVFPFGNRAIAGEILGEEHLFNSDHSFEDISYVQESSEGHGPPVPWPLQKILYTKVVNNYFIILQIN